MSLVVEAAPGVERSEVDGRTFELGFIEEGEARLDLRSVRRCRAEEVGVGGGVQEKEGALRRGLMPWRAYWRPEYAAMAAASAGFAAALRIKEDIRHGLLSEAEGDAVGVEACGGVDEVAEGIVGFEE